MVDLRMADMMPDPLEPSGSYGVVDWHRSTGMRRTWCAVPGAGHVLSGSMSNIRTVEVIHDSI